MTAVIICPVTHACYVDAAYAYVCGCHLSKAEQRTIDIEGAEWLFWCTHGDRAEAFTDLDKAVQWIRNGGRLEMMPIRHEPKEPRTRRTRPQVRAKVRRAA